VGRSVSSDLQNLLDLGACETQSTFDIYPVASSNSYFSTKAHNVFSITRTNDLRSVGEIKQAIGSQTDRVKASIQNIDMAIGVPVTAETYIKAAAVVGRYYNDPRGILPAVWVELFRGEMVPGELTEGAFQTEVLNDLAAAGYCVASESLAENCQWVYKQADTCGFAGAAATCNKKRKSLDGCLGKIVTGTTTNEYRFGGMEYPDIQTASVTTGDTGGPGGGFHTCPRLDQFVLVKSRWAKPVAIRVRDLEKWHCLFNPIAGTYHRLKSLRIITSEPIWEMWADNGAVAFSSFTHRVMASEDVENYDQAKSFEKGDRVLTYSNALEQDVLVRSRDTRERADVLHIEMEDGHIYAVGDEPDAFIVCHNSKPPEDPN
jgi:hypothetical protein